MPFKRKGMLAFFIACITLSTWALSDAIQNSAVASELTTVSYTHLTLPTTPYV